MNFGNMNRETSRRRPAGTPGHPRNLRRTPKGSLPGNILMALTLLFFYLPILFMVVFSFNSSKSLTSFTGFSQRCYETMLKSHRMPESP